MGHEVERVQASDLHAIRHTVLSPDDPPESARRPGDDHPRAVHLAIRDSAGMVVATGSVFPEPAAWEARSDSWRLRGMAVAAGSRNRGLGSAVLKAMIDHVALNGGGLLWCTARTAALTLYRRAGFVTHGEVFEDGHHGPHVVMWRLVEPAE